jgi:hypothetical protein
MIKLFIYRSLADAWFGTKTMIRTALELEVCAILRMKKVK